MKIKRFNNLWAMGLILCGALLVAFYVAKILFPEFIIGIAETPKIVELGTFIQGNILYLCLFNILTGYLYGYIYCCACCRRYKLNLNANLILLSSNIVLVIIMILLPEYYNIFNYVSFILTPFLICLENNTLVKETFISTTVCFSLDLIFQILSLLVRNLALLTTKGNVITFLILLIDGLIWRIIFYLFFNYKNKIKEIK